MFYFAMYDSLIWYFFNRWNYFQDLSRWLRRLSSSKLSADDQNLWKLVAPKYQELSNVWKYQWRLKQARDCSFRQEICQRGDKVCFSAIYMYHRVLCSDQLLSFFLNHPYHSCQWIEWTNLKSLNWSIRSPCIKSLGGYRLLFLHPSWIESFPRNFCFFQSHHHFYRLWLGNNYRFELASRSRFLWVKLRVPFDQELRPAFRVNRTSVPDRWWCFWDQHRLFNTHKIISECWGQILAIKPRISHHQLCCLRKWGG